jgi:hypothetical protein
VSFADRPGLTTWQKVGCAIYFVFAFIAACALFWLGLFPLLVEPFNPAALFFLLGGLVVLGGSGFLLMRFFTRDSK